MSAHQTSADGPVLATASPPESAVADELHERLAEVVARASATLGVSPVAGDDLAIVRSLLAAVDDRLEQAGLGAASAERHSTELARLEARFEQRGQALTRAHAAAIGLRRLTSPDALLAHAPAALCQGSGFGRALLSMIRESAMVPLALHVEGDPEQEAALRTPEFQAAYARGVVAGLESYFRSLTPPSPTRMPAAPATPSSATP